MGRARAGPTSCGAPRAAIRARSSSTPCERGRVAGHRPRARRHGRTPAHEGQPDGRAAQGAPGGREGRRARSPRCCSCSTPRPGQNGLVQARQFTEAVEVTGVVLTKLDGSAKGGIVVAIQAELGIPVKLVGLGETRRRPRRLRRGRVRRRAVRLNARRRSAESGDRNDGARFLLRAAAAAGPGRPARRVAVGFACRTARGRRCRSGSRRGVGRLLGLRGVLALVAGLAIGLLFAPGPGRELRDRLRALAASRRGRRSTPSWPSRSRFELQHAPRTWHLPQPTVDGRRPVEVTLSGAGRARRTRATSSAGSPRPFPVWCASTTSIVVGASRRDRPELILR